MSKLNIFRSRGGDGPGVIASVLAAKRACPLVLAAMASLAVAYGFEVHPLVQFGGSIPLSDMAPGLAQAFSQLGNVTLPALTRHAPTENAVG